MITKNRQAIVLSLLLTSVLVLLPGIGLAAPKGTNSVTSVVTGVAGGTLGGQAVPSASNFVGTLTVTGFQVVNGALNAVATLAGNVYGPTGTLIGAVPLQTINLPLALNGSCPILNLTLGPLDLNLLGLTIHLNQVVLNIVAVPGDGNLLGNLLCAVANLLNAGGPLQTLLNNLVTALNAILAAL